VLILMYDAIIVGARCAGSSLALLLARRGARVLLVDRVTFPSDTLNGHYIQPTGVRSLARWGVLDRVLGSGTATPIRSAEFSFGPIKLKGHLAWPDGHPAMAVAPRRLRLDALLVDAADDAGAEVRQGVSVTDLLWEDGRVVGITGHGRDGRPIAERATLVVGADGIHSRVARAVGAASYAETPPQTCLYYSHWANLPVSGFEGYFWPGRYVLMFPADDGLTCVAVGWSHAEFNRVRANFEVEFAREIQHLPEVADRLSSARRAEPLRGTADLPGFLRMPHGPGWALVGDAGWRVDPITGTGLSYAFRDAELLADAVSAGLGGVQPIDAALAAYRTARDQAGMPLYQFTCERPRLAPPSPDQQRLIAALRNNQAEIDRFAGISAGIVAPADFFSPRSVARILGEAASVAA
jgi:flavin-dependent dehydrogenase